MRLQVIPRAEELQAFESQMEDSLAKTSTRPCLAWYIVTRTGC